MYLVRSKSVALVCKKIIISRRLSVPHLCVHVLFAIGVVSPILKLRSPAWAIMMPLSMQNLFNENENGTMSKLPLSIEVCHTVRLLQKPDRRALAPLFPSSLGDVHCL